MLPRIDTELQAVEEKQGIQRWTEDSDVYLGLKRMEEEKEKNRIADSIATCAGERWFLLNLKARFAGVSLTPHTCTIHVIIL